MRLPPALSAGARVALVSPAGPLGGQDELDLAVAQATSLGWEPVPAPHALSRRGYLAGEDAARAADLNAAFSDDTIDGVWCLRGGYGAMRLLRALDYDALDRHPKALVGYSDITALHAAVAVKCGIISYHGPTARATLSDFSRDSLTRAVTNRTDSCGLAAGSRVLRGGRARGRLVGGNLALLSSLAGTPFAPDYTDAILVLEDVYEPAYRVDRMLRQLELSGALGRVAGIACGHFTEAGEADDDASRLLDNVLREAADLAGVPALAGIPMGHVRDQWTIPLGAMAELDTDAHTLNVVPG